MTFVKLNWEFDKKEWGWSRKEATLGKIWFD